MALLFLERTYNFVSAPPHCLQYYQGTHGTVQSFNYIPSKATLKGRERRQDRPEMQDVIVKGDGYPNNMDYIICIRKESGFCSITYEYVQDKQSGDLLPFSVGPTNGLMGGIIVGDKEAKTLTGSHCDDDFLIVGGNKMCSKLNVQSEQTSDQETESPMSSVSPEVPQSREMMTPFPLNNGTFNGNLYERLEEYQVDTINNSSNTDLHEGFRKELKRRESSSLNSSRRYIRSTGEEDKAKQSNKLLAIDNTPGPFQLRFVSNGAKNAKGFYLAFRQNPCRF